LHIASGARVEDGNMATRDHPPGDGEPRPSQDSLSSVSTTSIVFDRIHEQTEKQSLHARNKEGNGATYADDDLDLDDEDPLREPRDGDLETGPFLGNRGAAQGRQPAQPMDKKLRRILIIVTAVFLLGWLASLGAFLATGSYKHLSEAEHDPDADRRAGKVVNLDQIRSGFWSAKSHSISWIAHPDGVDGLLLEERAKGKDYLVVGDVRAGGGDNEASGTAHESLTLMKSPSFNFNDEVFQPQWNSPSPDLKKVLLAVSLERNWRHSFTAVYFILDVESQNVEPLVPLDAAARVQLASWSPKSDAVAFTRDNNLYVRRLDDKAKDGSGVVQVTRDGGAECFNGVPDWVYEEEVIQGRSATWWSDDGKHLAFLRTNETGVPEYPIQYFVSRPSGKEPAEGEENYPEVRQIKYPKAGAHNPVVEVRYYDVEKEEVFSVGVDDQFPDDDRIVNFVVWAGAGKVLVKQTNRVSDVLQVILVNVEERKARVVRSRDVGKEDGGWFEISHRMTYVPADPSNGRPQDGYVDSVIHDGYDHIAYFTPLDAAEPIMLTSGEWEVDEAPSAVDLKGNLVYFVAARESPIQRHVYSVNLLDGSNLTNLTNTDHEAYYGASFSTGAGYVLLTYRGPNIPTQHVVSTPSNIASYDRIIEDNAQLADRARKHLLPVLKYGELELDTGVTVNYVERRPPHFHPDQQYPVLFQQYSGPGSQQVTKKFAVDFQSYVASALGYVVITVDPRGTGFRGRAHRVPVRSQLGVLEAQDHIAAAAHFASQKHVDPARLAIWGWSYGGFTTLKTLEQDAGRTFSYGMAVAPVTDWRFYDSIYTERYMRLPDDNVDGYDASSVRNASALGDSVRFLLMHGVADDNVHFQNSLTLLDALDLAGVENYDVHVFPDSDHGIYFHNAGSVVYDSTSHAPHVSLPRPPPAR
jgi:dipeptidyl aminopeptidase